MDQLQQSRDCSLFSFVFLIISIRVLLDLNYVYLISPQLAYAGLELDLNVAKLVLSYLVLLIVGLLVRKTGDSPSSFGVLLLTVFIVLPVTSYWAMKDEANELFFIVVSSILIVRLLVAGRPLKLPGLKDGHWFFLALAVLITLAFFLPLIAKGGLNHMSLSLEGTYDRRSYFRENLASGYTGYLMSWFAKIINPALMAFLVIKRRYYLVALLFGLQLIDYSMTTMKAHVLFPLFVFFVFYIREKQADIKLWFLTAITSIAALSLLIGLFSEFRIVVALISRSFFSIAQNHFDYYAFFQNSEFVYWTNSPFNLFGSYRYDEPIAAIIGFGRYQEGEAAFANTGYIASGYSHLGIAGVLLYSVILGVILKLFDSLAENVPTSLALSVSGLAILQLVTSDLTTALLSHGVLLAMLVLFLLGSGPWFNVRHFLVRARVATSAGGDR